MFFLFFTLKLNKAVFHVDSYSIINQYKWVNIEIKFLLNIIYIKKKLLNVRLKKKKNIKNYNTFCMNFFF